jgi:hypothetical protein
MADGAATKARGEVTQQLMERDHAEGDLDEAATVLFPPGAQTPGDFCQGRETQLFAGLAKPTLLVDSLTQGLLVPGGGEGGEALDLGMIRRKSPITEPRQDLLAERTLYMMGKLAEPSMHKGGGEGAAPRQGAVHHRGPGLAAQRHWRSGHSLTAASFR